MGNLKKALKPKAFCGAIRRGVRKHRKGKDMKLYRLSETDFECMPYVFCSSEDMAKVCDAEEIENREADEIEVSEAVVELLKETTEETYDMGMCYQENFDGIASAYLNGGEELKGFIEYLREDGFDELAERWERVTGCVPKIKEWKKKKLAEVEILSVRKLSAYEKAKEKAKYLATEYQHESVEWRMTYSDLHEWGDYFRKLGKRYGLLEEFEENGII